MCEIPCTTHNLSFYFLPFLLLPPAHLLDPWLSLLPIAAACAVHAGCTVLGWSRTARLQAVLEKWDIRAMLYRDLLALGAAHPVPPAACRAEDVAALLFTAGQHKVRPLCACSVGRLRSPGRLCTCACACACACVPLELAVSAACICLAGCVCSANPCRAAQRVHEQPLAAAGQPPGSDSGAKQQQQRMCKLFATVQAPNSSMCAGRTPAAQCDLGRRARPAWDGGVRPASRWGKRCLFVAHVLCARR